MDGMSDSNEPTGLAKLRQEMDQMGATLEDFAPVLAQFHRALIAEGFTPKESILLTAEYLKATLEK